MISLILAGCGGDQPALINDCQPTRYEEIGPFYRSNAPIRDKVGKGYILSGTVLSAGDCRPLARAMIELWLVNPQGEYDDAHRATIYADRRGRYTFESNRPSDYIGRKPHIHIMVTAEGHERLVSQHYPEEGTSKEVFDLVLVPLSMNGK